MIASDYKIEIDPGILREQISQENDLFCSVKSGES